MMSSGKFVSDGPSKGFVLLFEMMRDIGNEFISHDNSRLLFRLFPPFEAAFIHPLRRRTDPVRRRGWRHLYLRLVIRKA